MNRVGIALIAKNEEERLPTLLASIDGAFDRAVLLDTGSTDNTIQVFQDWARTQTGMTFSVGKYEWQLDFSHAREAADGLLLYGAPEGYSTGMEPLVDWKCWADCDDYVQGAQNIRGIVEAMPPEVVYLFAGYQYAFHEGKCICYLRRERLTRVPYGKWMGRVHEAQGVDAPMMNLRPEDLEYIHRKDMSQTQEESSNVRNLEILEKWNAEEPDNPRIVGYLGTEYAVHGENEKALTFYEEYHKLESGWDEERAQMYRKWAQSLYQLGRVDEGFEKGFEAMRVMPNWPDSYLTLAEGCTMRAEWTKAFDWAKRAIEIGMPDTMLIINPLDYTQLPMKIMAGCAAEMGRDEEAIALAERAQELYNDPQVVLVMRKAQVRLKRENTASTFVMCAEQLINHDEQLKALTLLESCVPYFAMEHPRIVALRSMLHQRLSWIHSKADFSEHYESGGSKPEDFIADDNVDALCEYLPRTNFLLDNLMEQYESSN